MRGLSWPLSGPRTPGDALEASRANTRRLPRPPSLAASHHRGLLTPPLSVATAARGTGAPPGGSRHGRSAPPPWPAYTAATTWPSRSRLWARAVAGAGVRSRGASRSYNRPDTRPTAAATRLRPGTAEVTGSNPVFSTPRIKELEPIPSYMCALVSTQGSTEVPPNQLLHLIPTG